MRIWVEKRGDGIQVNFQPDSTEEVTLLDGVLFGQEQGRSVLTPHPISEHRDQSVADGAPQVGEIGGHESQRWIVFRTQDLEDQSA